jgi:hypothetical protein
MEVVLAHFDMKAAVDGKQLEATALKIEAFCVTPSA